MKKLQKSIAFFLVAAFLLLLPANTLSVQAAVTTYCVKYVETSGEWRYKEGSNWDADGNEIGRELYYLLQDIKDGDMIVLEGSSGTGSTYELNLPVHLSNVTANASGGIVVIADSVENCYVLGGSYFAITADVTNAYIYNNAAVTFHGNVNYMEINQTYASDEDGNYNLIANVTCDGTVNQLVGQDSENGLHYQLYSFLAGKLVIEDGNVTTSESYFSYTAAETSSESTATNSEAASSRTYTVVRGDSLWKIANSNLGDGARYTEIMSLSGLTSTTIYTGQVLTLPAE